jgi:hypothetical protein
LDYLPDALLKWMRQIRVAKKEKHEELLLIEQKRQELDEERQQTPNLDIILTNKDVICKFEKPSYLR